MIKNKKKLNFIGITTISLILATIGGACTPDTSEDEDDYELTCTGTECRIANRILSCSQDGQFVYEYYDPQLPHFHELADDTDYAYGSIINYVDKYRLPVGPYIKNERVNEGPSFKFVYECDINSNYQCRIINNNIGCYHLCGTHGENVPTWCEQHKNTTHHFFRAITDTYPEGTECVLNPADAKYYTKSYMDTTFCPSDRPCDNTKGCTAYTEKDGKRCDTGSISKRSECVEQDGQSYALVCNYYSPATDPLTPSPDNPDKYYVATPCDACEYNNDLYSPYDTARCLEKCSTKGDVKDICEDDMNVHSVCEVKSNGQTYWSIKSTEFCDHGCDADGKCKIYPGEGEQCSPSQYHSKCVDKDTLMNCPVETKKATASSCSGMGLFLDYILSFSDNQSGDRNLICLETKDGAECVTEKNPNPCTKEGQKVTRCGILFPDNPEARTAYKTDLICKKYSDGSLRYVIKDMTALQKCATNKCNAAQSDCEK